MAQATRGLARPILNGRGRVAGHTQGSIDCCRAARGRRRHDIAIWTSVTTRKMVACAGARRSSNRPHMARFIVRRMRDVAHDGERPEEAEGIPRREWCSLLGGIACRGSPSAACSARVPIAKVCAPSSAPGPVHSCLNRSGCSHGECGIRLQGTIRLGVSRKRADTTRRSKVDFNLSHALLCRIRSTPPSRCPLRAGPSISRSLSDRCADAFVVITTSSTLQRLSCLL